MKCIYIARERLHDGRPAIAIDTGEPEVKWCHELDIDGPSRLVHSEGGLKGRSEIKVWLETHAPIRTYVKGDGDGPDGTRAAGRV